MKQKLTWVMAHAAGWIFFFSLVIGFVYRGPNNQSVSSTVFSQTFFVFGIVYLFLFYFNIYLLIPKLYLRKRYLVYFACVLFLFACVYFLKPFDSLMKQMQHTQKEGRTNLQPGKEFRPGPPPMNGAPDRPAPAFNNMPQGPPPTGNADKGKRADIVSIILFITVWSLGTAICIIRQWRIAEQKMIQAEADKANAELSFLKAQINPHFLFNTLNNIYSLAITKDDNAAASIMKLSNIMRYVTDDVHEDFVPLDNEIEYLKDYIDLQKMRLGSKTTIDFSVQGNTGTKKIAPLLLMTFIENVFKYGISKHEASVITIKITVSESSIDFFCQNRLFETKRNIERTGIGLANTRQRLQHLYMNKHVLNIDEGNGLFTVQLTLLT